MTETRLVLVGGFLGAGKTTLLWETARRLSAGGRRVGLITNDQAPELVDTALLAKGGGRVEEVSGSCFCCNFPGLLESMNKLRKESEADILIAEPVGSCTDLSATIIQPLKDTMSGELTLSPLSVLVDATRLGSILEGGTAGLHRSAAYILRKQMEEADIIVISKTDLIAPGDLSSLETRVTDRHPTATVISMSAKNGEGLEKWLVAVTTRTDAGRTIADVDYDVYAEGEAVLGWLNATFDIGGEPTEWRGFTSDLLTALSRRFDSTGAAVGHVKVMLEAGGRSVLGNLTGGGDTLSIRGAVLITDSARLIINARVEMAPETLDAAVREIVAAAGEGRIRSTPLAFRCISPGRPNPTHRYDRVVEMK